MATIPLEQLRVASPCTVDWDHMAPAGSPGVRHCGQCDLNVYNISEMTREGAERFIAGTTPGARTCIRFYRRTDGTVLTRDCPVGLRAARLHLVRVITRTAAALAMLVSLGAVARSRARDQAALSLSEIRPFSALCEWVRGRPALPPNMPLIMGEMACPTPPAPVAPATSSN